MHFSVESYLESAARKFIRDFDPCCYLYLSQAIDWYDLSDGHADMQDAFADLKLESVKVIGVRTDALWPPHQQKEIADMFRLNGTPTELEMLDSITGHDSFLVDYEQFCPSIEKWFDGIR